MYSDPSRQIIKLWFLDNYRKLNNERWSKSSCLTEAREDFPVSTCWFSYCFITTQVKWTRSSCKYTSMATGNQKYVNNTLLISDESLIGIPFISRQHIRLLLKWHDVTVLGLVDNVKALREILATLNNLFKIVQY